MYFCIEFGYSTVRSIWQNDQNLVMVFTYIRLHTPDWPHILLALYLQSEGQNHIRLGQRVLVLLAHVDDGGVVSPFQLLEFELASLGHRHALQIGHQLIH